MTTLPDAATLIGRMASAYLAALPQDERDEDAALRRCRTLYCQLDSAQTEADRAALAAIPTCAACHARVSTGSDLCTQCGEVQPAIPTDSPQPSAELRAAHGCTCTDPMSEAGCPWAGSGVGGHSGRQASPRPVCPTCRGVRPFRCVDCGRGGQ